MHRALQLAICCLPMIACTKSAEEGTEQGPCYPNRTCNAGLTCLSHTCVRLPDSDTGSPDRWVGSPDGLVGQRDQRVSQHDRPVSQPDRGPADAVDGILNGDSASSASTHWNCAGPYTGCGQFAFYADRTYHYLSSGSTVKSGTWTKLGPAALVLNPAAGSVSSLSSIKGSISQGQFTANIPTGAAYLFGIAGGNI